jgi:hypothetical protein
MLTVHHVTAFLVLAVTGVAAIAAFVAAVRARGAGRIVAQVLALAQTILVAQVVLGLMLVGQHRRAADHLHYLYGTLALVTIASPWLYAPDEPRRRLLWFGGATLLAAALAVRAYMTAT